MEPALLTLLGLEPAPAGGRDVLFAAWRIFFERIAERSTTVLLFEDLQWADSGLLDFIEHLLEWSKSVPLIVVTLARPELFERRPDWGTETRNLTKMALEPLSDDAMRLLLDGFVPGLPEAAIRAILARADGMPLYAVETVRSLVADGRLARDGDAYRPVGELGELAIPDTLRSLIASRLDALDPVDRSLVADASVLGQTFSLAGLVAVSGQTADALEPRLKALVRRELFDVEIDPRSPERGQYRFVQSLIREVAYGTLAKRERRARHLAAARYFEALGDDELAGALASHYVAAHQASAEGAEADAVAIQARLALSGAAERAATLGAHDQAVAYLEQALTVTTDPAEQAQLLERAGDSATAAGRYEAAEGYLRRAIEVHRAVADRVGVARATANLGRVLITGRHGDVALTLLEAARVEFADLEGDAAGAALGGQLARAHYLTGNLRACDRDGRSGVADGRAPGPRSHRRRHPRDQGFGARAGRPFGRRPGTPAGRPGACRTARPRRHAHAGRQQSCGPRGPEGPAGGLGDRPRRGRRRPADWGRRNATLIYNAAVAARRVGEWTWGLEVLDEALAEDFESSDRADLLTGSILFRALLGDPTDELVAEVERLLGGATDPYRIATLDSGKGWVAFSRGRLGEARERWRRVIELIASPADLPYPARAALWDRDADAVRADLAELDASGVHGPALEADRTTIRAGIAALEGRTADALALYREALRAWRDLGLAWDEALCAIDMAMLLDPAEPEVQAAAERAGDPQPTWRKALPGTVGGGDDAAGSADCITEPPGLAPRGAGRNRSRRGVAPDR